MIAAKADSHYYIYKEIEEKVAKTKVRELKEAEILYELARMSTGEITKTALKNVLEMKTAYQLKKMEKCDIMN